MYTVDLLGIPMIHFLKHSNAILFQSDFHYLFLVSNTCQRYHFTAKSPSFSSAASQACYYRPKLKLSVKHKNLRICCYCYLCVLKSIISGHLNKSYHWKGSWIPRIFKNKGTNALNSVRLSWNSKSLS